MPADHVTPHRIVAEIPAEEVVQILGTEIARRNGRDFETRRAAAYELVREIGDDGLEMLTGVRLSVEWSGPSSAPAVARGGRPSSSPAGAAAAVELVGMDL